jgi:hypothetical protein
MLRTKKRNQNPKKRVTFTTMMTSKPSRKLLKKKPKLLNFRNKRN